MEKYDNHGCKVHVHHEHFQQQISCDTSSHVTAVQTSFDASYMTRISYKKQFNYFNYFNSFILHYVNIMYYCIRFTLGGKKKKQLTPCCVLAWKVCVPGRLFFFPSPAAHKLLLSQPSSYLKPLSGLQWRLKYNT